MNQIQLRPGQDLVAYFFLSILSQVFNRLADGDAGMFMQSSDTCNICKGDHVKHSDDVASHEAVKLIPRPPCLPYYPQSKFCT